MVGWLQLNGSLAIRVPWFHAEVTRDSGYWSPQIIIYAVGGPNESTYITTSRGRRTGVVHFHRREDVLDTPTPGCVYFGSRLDSQAPRGLWKLPVFNR